MPSDPSPRQNKDAGHCGTHAWRSPHQEPRPKVHQVQCARDKVRTGYRNEIKTVGPEPRTHKPLLEEVENIIHLRNKDYVQTGLRQVPVPRLGGGGGDQSPRVPDPAMRADPARTALQLRTLGPQAGRGQRVWWPRRRPLPSGSLVEGGLPTHRSGARCQAPGRKPRRWCSAPTSGTEVREACAAHSPPRRARPRAYVGRVRACLRMCTVCICVHQRLCVRVCTRVPTWGVCVCVCVPCACARRDTRAPNQDPQSRVRARVQLSTCKGHLG